MKINFSLDELRQEKLKRLKREQLRRAAQNSLKDFILYNNDDYMMGWVHEEICETLDQFYEDVKAKKSPRIIICLPPRSGKSEIISRNFPAYLFGRDPNLNIISASYSGDLASRFNLDVQRIIDSDNYKKIFPETFLGGKAYPQYKKTDSLFEIVNHKGSYRSAGVGGGVTGMGCDILIIDDPFKDRADANSPTIREKTYDWYKSTAYTRLSDGGGIIILQTRWHIADLAGQLISKMHSDEKADQFKVIEYQAIAEHDEKHRKKGEALHPERYSLAKLEAIRQTLGAYEWAALYQQHPVPKEGATFKLDNFRRYNEKNIPVSFDRILGSWDMTFKDKKDNDFVVGQVWGKKGADFYLLDQVRGQWDFVKTLQVFIQLAEKWKRCHGWLIEDKANGSAIISTLKKHISGLKPINPTESKIARAEAISIYIETGNVYIPENAPYIADLEDEIINFPAVDHDDQIDCMTQALNYFRENAPLQISENNLKILKLSRLQHFRR